MCIASGGHLVSLDSNLIEDELTQKSTLSDFWCGGNMCTDSPGILSIDVFENFNIKIDVMDKSSLYKGH